MKILLTNWHMLGVPWIPRIVFFFMDIFVLRCKKPASQIVLSRVKLLYTCVKNMIVIDQKYQLDTNKALF